MPSENTRGYGTYILESFELEYGKVVEDIRVDYHAVGTPKYDDEGHITNAIVFCPSLFKSGPSFIKGTYDYLKRENKFDEDRFFFITVTPFGIPPSYSPSSTNLKYNFPEYSFKDIVNFKKQFISEKFKIKQLLGIMGEKHAGYEVFTWATEYPDDMKFILILNSDFKLSGYRYIMAKGFEAIVTSQDSYLSDEYSSSLSNAMIAIYSFVFAQFMSEKILSNLTTDELEIYLEEFVDEGLTIDIYDFNYWNNAILNYNVEDKLKNITARTLIIYLNDNVFFNHPLDMEVVKENVEDLKLLCYKSKKENYYDDEDYSLIAEDVDIFLKDCVED